MTVDTKPEAQREEQEERPSELEKPLVAVTSEEVDTPAPGPTPLLGPNAKKSPAPTPLGTVELPDKADEGTERKYLKTGVEFGKQTTQWAYDEINKRELPFVGKNTCTKLMETTKGLLAYAGLDKLAPQLVSSGLSTLDTYVEKADGQLEKVLETERGQQVEAAVISATQQGIELATQTKERAVAVATQTKERAVETISGLKATASSTLERVSGTTQGVVDTVMANETVAQVTKAAEDIVISALEQSGAAYDAAIETKETAVKRVQDNVEFVKQLPNQTLEKLTEYTDYDGDGTVTIQDLRNTVNEQLEALQQALRARTEKGLDYLLPAQVEEMKADGEEEDADEMQQVSLRSTLMNRLAQRFQKAQEQAQAMTTPYIGETGIKVAQQASQYVEYLRGLELKDLPIPAAAQAKFVASLEFASKQVTYVKTAFFALLTNVNLEEYAAECGKPFETITPYLERLAQEKSITEVPAEVVNIATTLIGIQRGGPEVQNLTSEIENLMNAICDVSTLFNLTGKLDKDG